jgi:hypothetical protein
MQYLVLAFFIGIIRSLRNIADVIAQNRSESSFFQDILPPRDLEYRE